MRTYTYTYTDISPESLTASDLRTAAEGATTPPQAVAVTIYEGGMTHAMTAEALVIDDRIGIAWGADAAWGDVRGDMEAAIEDWLNDVEAWEARN